MPSGVGDNAGGAYAYGGYVTGDDPAAAVGLIATSVAALGYFDTSLPTASTATSAEEELALALSYTRTQWPR